MPKRKAPFAVRLFVWLILVALLIIGGAFWYWNNLISPVDQDGSSQPFVVQKGEAISDIAQDLENKKLIHSALAFKILLKLSGDQAHIEAGDFKISPAMSTQEVIQSLSRGATDKWVTLLEGWRIEQMAQQVKADLGISEEAFLKAAKGKEGHLFPDSYLFNKSTSAESVVEQLENTFNQKYTDDMQRKIHSKGLTSEQGIILASIVEREGRSDLVRKNVASILLKRFNMQMALNADATVQYAKDSQILSRTGKLDKFWQPVTLDDYHGIASAYNTYLYAGLPPAPICNPSESSLNAVANADPSTPYLYYYVDSQGNIYYAKTLEEHEANVAKHP